LIDLCCFRCTIAAAAATEMKMRAHSDTKISLLHSRGSLSALLCFLLLNTLAVQRTAAFLPLCHQFNAESATSLSLYSSQPLSSRHVALNRAAPHTSISSSSSSSSSSNNNNNPSRSRFRQQTVLSMTSNKSRDIWQTLKTSVSQTASIQAIHPLYRSVQTPRERRAMQLATLARVGVPSIVMGIVATLTFPSLSLGLTSWITQISPNDAAGALTVLSTDSSQFVQNFLTVAGLLFSILVGQTFYFMYQQQESVYYALFNEVTEAKSLLEQVALVCQGRSMYPKCLQSIQRYVQDDLKQLQADPAVLLSARPVDDPLEAIMYLTSVGVPSTVYETVRSLRQARATRLGALQRKLPAGHIGLLWVLALIQLLSFPLLGAGTFIIGGYRILTVEGLLFGIMTGGVVLTLRVVGELWRPAGGAYNVDQVLSVMVSGLEAELDARMAGGKVTTSLAGSTKTKWNDQFPSSASEELSPLPPVREQGANVVTSAVRTSQWIHSQWRRRRGDQRRM
jgi:hypothetical protein